MTPNPVLPLVRRALMAVALLLVLGGLVGASELPAVSVRPLQGGRLEGPLLSLGPASLTVATSSGPRTARLTDLRSVTLQRPAPASLRRSPHLRVLLTGGERLLGTYAGPIPDGLILETPGMGRVPLLFEVIRSLVAVPANAAPCFEPEHGHPRLDGDVAYLQSGDAYQGLLLAATQAGLEIETSRGRTRVLPWDELLVVHLENDVPPPAEGLVLEIETADGALVRIAKDLVLGETGTLDFALRSLPQKQLAMSVAQMKVLRAWGASFVYATELPFTGEFTPYYAKEDPPGTSEILKGWLAVRAGRRASGCPLRLDGKTYRHGFAAQAKSTITLPLGGAYREFQALFGVDDEAATDHARGIVDARVLGDGKVLWKARDVRAGESPRRVGPIEVSGVTELVLEVDFGAELFVLDRVVWAEPILLRK